METRLNTYRLSLLGYIKDIMHNKRFQSVPDLRRRIAVAVAAVSVDVLSRVWAEFEFRFDVCRAVNDSHFVLY
jgi:hypothetical protein